MRPRRSRLLALAGLISMVWGCRSAPRREAKAPQVGWRPIVTFSGRESTQTESFNIESTEWRIRWEARSPSKRDTGTFQVVVHSAVSGRPLMESVHQNGPGRGIAYVVEDPRLYHLVINAKDLDWSIAVDEAVVGAAP